MKKIYMCPVTDIIGAEAEGMICASIIRKGVIDGNNDGISIQKNPNTDAGLHRYVTEWEVMTVLRPLPRNLIFGVTLNGNLITSVCITI